MAAGVWRTARECLAQSFVSLAAQPQYGQRSLKNTIHTMRQFFPIPGSIVAALALLINGSLQAQKALPEKPSSRQLPVLPEKQKMKPKFASTAALQEE
jgi:hypothetical protein